MRQQRRGQADRAQQVGRDNRLGVCQISRLFKELLRAHDSRVVDQNIERGEFLGNIGGKRADGAGLLDVENQRLHPRIRGSRLVQHSLAAAGNDDLVAQFVKRLGKGAADSRASAGDKDRVTGRIHKGFS